MPPFETWSWSRARRPATAVLALFTVLLPRQDVGPGRWGLLGVGAQKYICDEKCQKCHLFDYDQSWHCIECKPGYELWVDGCFLPCPLGQYRYGYKCLPCTAHCNHCVGGLRHECTQCSRGFTLDFRGVCVRQCEDGFFPTLDGNSCEECNAYCKTCLSEYRISCTSCFDGYRHRVLDAVSNSGECMQDCPVGYFRDSTIDLRCIQCGQYCEECDSIENCFKCQESASLYRGLCYLVPGFVEAIDFDSYMASGAGMSVDINDPNRPTWQSLMEGRRLREEKNETCGLDAHE